MRIPLAAITDFLSDTSSLTAAVPAGLLQANDKVYYRQAPGLRRGAVCHTPVCHLSAPLHIGGLGVIRQMEHESTRLKNGRS